MESNKVEILEPNKYVLKYEWDLFRKNSINYANLIDKDTREEHARQMKRIRQVEQNEQYFKMELQYEIKF